MWVPADKKIKAVEILLTWVEHRIHTNFPRSHEPTNLLQVSPSNNILEDDVIGEVHCPLGGCDRNYRCRLFLCLCGTCWAVPWPFAVWRDVCWCRRVSGRVVWRGVICGAVLCRFVLWGGRVWGCVRWRCVIWGGVLGGSVVSWCVLWAACVRRRRHTVAVLHACNGCSSSPSSLLGQKEGSEKSKGMQQSSKKTSILCSVSYLSSPHLSFILLRAFFRSFTLFCSVHIHFFSLVWSSFFSPMAHFSCPNYNLAVAQYYLLLHKAAICWEQAGEDPFISSVVLFQGPISSDFSLQMSGPCAPPPTVWSHGHWHCPHQGIIKNVDNQNVLLTRDLNVPS